MTVDELTAAPAGNATGQRADPLLNTRQAAGYLNVPLNTLQNHWRAWGFRPFRVGRSLQFEKSALDMFLERNRETGELPPGDPRPVP
jgi:helix-turn-helix protein